MVLVKRLLRGFKTHGKLGVAFFYPGEPVRVEVLDGSFFGGARYHSGDASLLWQVGWWIVVTDCLPACERKHGPIKATEEAE
jgi:hypothetical protein